MGIPLFQVDAFTDRPFAGNPAAVCILDDERPDKWMQQVAAEMNLAETAFLLRRPDDFGLRWFTPVLEVDLCGHATLASAHALWEGGYLKPGQQARFHTRSGLLTAKRSGDWIEMDFPSEPPEPASAPPELTSALGLRPRWVGKNRFDYLIEVESEEALRAARPDFRALAQAPVRGVIVTSQCQSGGYDFVSRFFAPAVGIDEDPATGSAHCCLGPFWSERLSKDDLLGYQASPRGGVVRVRVGDRRMTLGGQAVMVLRGELI
jgi:PhzF family phenazine biosynthesis protein